MPELNSKECTCGAVAARTVDAVFFDIPQGIEIALFHRDQYTREMKKGMFIVLDGNDGSGKATQTKLLYERFMAQGVAVEKVDFPRYGVEMFGALIGECLAGQHGDFLHLDPKIASTLYALDRFEASDHIRTALSEGKIIIADRFSSSNQIHQGGKIENAEERETFLSWLDRMEHEVLGIPRPDAVIYLEVPIEKSLHLLEQKRATKNETLGSEEKDTVEKDRQYLERSHSSALMLAESRSNWHVVKCMRNDELCTLEEIHEDVYAIVEKLQSAHTG